MIERGKRKAGDGTEATRSDKAPKPKEKAAGPAFPLYGRGGRAWVERSWHGMSTSFDQGRMP